ncbi:hypothetical protein HQ403_02570 [Candidatus Kaiserbacteria bacterium]|nr:hypothetical protein [Candidatus Kaiserbacteria bacterium]
MSGNPINELEEKFNAFINEKDDHRFFLRLSKYFQFIEDTFPLDNIVKKLFSSPSELSMFKNIEGLYNSIVLHKSPTRFSISPSSVDGSGIRTLHKRLIEEARKSGLARVSVIERSVDGSYTFNGATIPFGRKTIKYHIFDYLYNSPSHRVSYAEIDKYLVRNGFGVMKNNEKRSERIRRAVTGYRDKQKKHSQVGNISILEIEHNFGVKLNNPLV